MPDALNPSDLMEASRLFLPLSGKSVVDRIYIQSYGGELYSLTAIVGSDIEVGEDFFILNQLPCDEKSLPEGGAWYDVDLKHTKLRTEYKYRKNRLYRNFQELHDVYFFGNNLQIVISRTLDEFGVEKLLVKIEEK